MSRKSSTKSVREDVSVFSLADDDEDEEEEEANDDHVWSRTIVGAGEAGRPATRALYKLTVLSALGGFLFGYDTGVVSGAMVLIVKVRFFTTLSKFLVA